MSVAAEAVAVDLFDHRELAVVERALAAVASRAPADADVLRGLIRQLREAQILLDESRALRAPTALGGEPRTESTLIGHLISLDGLSGDLALPLKANLSRTYLLTKINFLRAFVKATTALERSSPEFHEFSHDLREELGQSIYTLLAEELFLAMLRKPDIDERIKRRAALWATPRPRACRSIRRRRRWRAPPPSGPEHGRARLRGIASAAARPKARRRRRAE